MRMLDVAIGNYSHIIQLYENILITERGRY